MVRSEDMISALHERMRDVASDAGLETRPYEMPNHKIGWMVNVAPEMIGDERTAIILRRLGHIAREEGTSVFACITNTAFDEDTLQPHGARPVAEQRLYKWLIDDVGWHSLGNSAMGLGELVGICAEE